MITCSNCGHKEYVGALYCAECGSRLELKLGRTTQSLYVDTNESKRTDLDFSEVPTNESSGALVTLHFLDENQYLPLLGEEDFTFGRSSEGQKTLPDVDLTQFDAYRKGVSRIHAAIRIEGDLVSVRDLGSINGTRLNGNKIPPQVPYTVRNGDIIAFGKLKFQALFRT